MTADAARRQLDAGVFDPATGQVLDQLLTRLDEAEALFEQLPRALQDRLYLRLDLLEKEADMGILLDTDLSCNGSCA